MKLFLCAALALGLAAQPIKWPASFERLAKKASEAVDVTLDGETLKLASKFLSSDRDQAWVKKLAGALEAIYIKSFEFENEGAYSKADIEEIRSQIKPAEWKRVINVVSKGDGETVEIFAREKDGKNAGFLILSAEPRELTVVQIVGPISLDDLAGLEGAMGIPRIGVKEKGAAPGKKED